VQEILGLMAPAIIGLAAVQLNIFIGSSFASHEQGAQTWLQSAFRVLYLPIGLFGVALGTIATAGLARHAAEGDMDGLRNTLRQSLSMLAYLTVPATIGLMTLGVPVVRLLYERGRFTPADTEATAAALLLYSLGLVGYTGVKVLAPAFYALDAPRVPLLASASAVGTNLVVIWAFHSRLGFRAIAIGTALGSLVNAALLVSLFERRVGGLFGHGLFRPVARMAIAAAAMGGLAWLTAAGLERAVGTTGFRAQLTTGLLPVIAGVALYGLLTRALGVGEAAALWQAAGRRLRPR
jgi:putative peptidoglycan lipid II flippase